MLYEPFYNPKKSYEENFESGPFGIFVDGKILENLGGAKYEFFGHKVFSPFGIPAGPLINGKFAQKALEKGFDLVVYKTVRTEKYPCHPWPNILAVQVEGDLTLEKSEVRLMANNKYEEPLSITNSFGVPSAPPEFWQKDIEKLIKETKDGQIVIGAFQGTKNKEGDADLFAKDFCACAKLLKEAGVKVFEVNLSCPNEGTGNLLCYDTEGSVKIIKKIKEELGTLPLIIKIGYFKDLEKFQEFVKRVGSLVEGISAINTIAAEIVDENGKQSLPGEGRLRSGVCGHSIKWAGLEMVGRLKKLREEFGYSYTIIGVGGVFNKEDFLEYQKKGADIVMSATGAMWNPYLAKEIKSKLN